MTVIHPETLSLDILQGPSLPSTGAFLQGDINSASFANCSSLHVRCSHRLMCFNIQSSGHVDRTPHALGSLSPRRGPWFWFHRRNHRGRKISLPLFPLRGHSLTNANSGTCHWLETFWLQMMKCRPTLFTFLLPVTKYLTKTNSKKKCLYSGFCFQEISVHHGGGSRSVHRGKDV